MKAQLFIALAGTLLPAICPAAPAADRPYKISANVGIKETFDSNVLLQSEGDKANRRSLVTSLIPQIGFGWHSGTLLQGTLVYGPEVNVFHSEHSEDFILHRTALKLSGRTESVSFDLNGTLVHVDGSSVNPTWTAPGGAPATGAPAIRDRRDATVFRSGAILKKSWGDWFIRPNVTAYVHNFQTEHRATAGYQNAVDRSEFTVGADAGRSLGQRAGAWVGYRLGLQDQATLLGTSEDYDNTFHRFLLGFDGAPARWLKASVALGPEVRRFGSDVSADFADRARVNLFVDASLTVTPTTNDTAVLSIKRFEQPGSGGRSTYHDLTIDLNWKHRIDQTWTVGFGSRAYSTLFRQPAERDDWVISGSVFASAALTAQTTAEASYVYETGITRTPQSSGREYARHLVALGVRHVFW